MTSEFKRKNRIAVLLLMGLLTLQVFADQVWNYPQPDADRDVKDLSFYNTSAQTGLLKNISSGQPRNVILLIGDGMSFNQVALARYSAIGAASRLYMEQMPVGGSMRTYAANHLTTDSAAAATALACGIKTDNGRIGTAPDDTAWQTILEKARLTGFHTGLVATSRITHATPAGFAAHVASRGSEEDIASQMLDCRVDILFGGGRKHWLGRRDGRNLIEEAKAAGYQVVYSADQMNALDAGPALGLFADDGMTTFAPEPMLHEMARAAIGLLSAAPGEWFAPKPRFFMMIEGSQIDWACHGNDPDNTVRQTLLFDLAVKEALDFARHDKQTLVVVTADHETGGLLIKEKGREPSADWNSKSHTAGDVPLYAFGPGSEAFGGAHDNTDIPKLIAQLLRFEDFPAPLKAEKPVMETANN